MELREPIEQINKRLIEEYGYADGSQPNFRVVFSDDQFEKRLTGYTDEGFPLLYPEVRELPKYRQYIHSKYLLERLVPVGPESDLTTKVSYECAWAFQDKDGNYLPPFFEGCKYIADALLSQAGRTTGHAKYKDPLIEPGERMRQVEAVERELFGNETQTGDALAYGSGVSLSGILPDLENMKTVVEETTKLPKAEVN